MRGIIICTLTRYTVHTASTNRRKPATHPGVRIARSPIQGLGVFATRRFGKGELIIRWDLSRILTKEQVAKLPKREQRYVSAYGPRRFILHVAPERFMNHSCKPNAKISRIGDVALRAIKAGEELTSDYAYEGGPVHLFTCSCGARGCRRVLEV